MPSRGFPRSIILAIVVSTVALPVTAMLAWPGPPVASAAEPRPAADRAVLGSAIVDATACRVGLEAVRLVGGQALHGVALTPSGGWAVGYASDVHEDDLYARRRPTVLLGAAGTWTRVPVRGSGREDGLMAVAARGDDRAWAVGFTTIQGAVMPLAIKWDGRRWRVARPRPVGQLDSVLTDVTIAVDGSPWAVGYRMAGDGRRRPIAVRRQDGRWRYLDPAAGRDTSVSLTAVAPDGAGGLWGVGYAGRGDAIGPAIYRRARGRWERLSLPPVAGEGVLTGIATVDARDAWAVGYQQDAGLTRPLVLRWDGRRWARIGEPGFRSSEVVLTAVAASTSGDIVVVGTRKVDGASIHEAVGARWDGRDWSALAGVGDSELFDVGADREGQGLAVGRAGRDAVIARSCPHDSWASVRIHEPAGAAQSAAVTAGGMGPFTAIEATGAEPRADGLEDDPETVPHAAGPGRVPGAERRLRSLRPLPHTKTLARLSARDVASQRGLPGRTSSRFLARPLTTALEQALVDQVAQVMSGPDFRDAWAGAHRVVHEQAVRLLRGGTDVLAVDEGLVTLSLFPLIDEILRQLQASGYIDPGIVLPDLRAPDAPEALRREMEASLGIDVPADYGSIQLLRSDELGALQRGVDAIDVLALIVFVATAAMIGLALLLAYDRRRMVLALAVGTLVTIAVARVVVGAWVEGIGASSVDEAVGQAVVALVEAVLDDLYAILFVVAGIAIAVTALVLISRGALPRAISDAVRDWIRPTDGGASLRSTVRAGAARHAKDLRWAGVGVVGFAVLWRVAGVDTALLAALALGAWLAVVNWLTTPQRRIGAASAVSASEVV